MNDARELIEQARSLGRALAAHARARKFAEAQRALREDATARALLTDYQSQAQRLYQLEQERKPIEPADKHKLADLQRQVAGNDLLKGFTRAQADFMELLMHVHNAVDEPMSQPGPTAGGEPRSA